MNLYKITLQGHGVHFVVATDPTAAYEFVKRWMDAKDYGFVKDRTLAAIDLVAESGEYPNTKDRLWITK
jgi:hypothetical protein